MRLSSIWTIFPGPPRRTGDCRSFDEHTSLNHWYMAQTETVVIPASSAASLMHTFVPTSKLQETIC